VAEIETDPEKTHAKAVGLGRWYREQLFKRLSQLLVGLFVLGGIITTLTTHHLVPALVCSSVAVAIALLMSVRTLLVLRALRRRPERTVARLTKRRRLQKAGFAPD
jgi:hypothetical protein